jgi:hypothetical protein
MRALVALAAALALAGSALAAQRTASLALVSRTPVTVAGKGFRPAQPVRVTATATNSIAVTVRPSRAGTFSVRLTGLVLGRCSGLFVRAQSATAVATLKLPRPACMPERHP